MSIEGDAAFADLEALDAKWITTSVTPAAKSTPAPGPEAPPAPAPAVAPPLPSSSPIGDVTGRMRFFSV